jgi:hypothetical protein
MPMQAVLSAPTAAPMASGRALATAIAYGDWAFSIRRHTTPRRRVAAYIGRLGVAFGRWWAAPARGLEGAIDKRKRKESDRACGTELKSERKGRDLW